MAAANVEIDQETIALYEERLSTSDAKRYEMEDLMATLEEQVRSQQRPPSPGAVARQASSALEIDNEALREQIQHLIRKASSLEDQLEDARMAVEHSEIEVQQKETRYREREEAVRAELTDSRKEVERVTKSEETARLRTEEMEEALRENTVALENARAEIEILRTEIAVRLSITLVAEMLTHFNKEPRELGSWHWRQPTQGCTCCRANKWRGRIAQGREVYGEYNARGMAIRTQADRGAA